MAATDPDMASGREERAGGGGEQGSEAFQRLGLSPEVADAAEALGWTQPTAVQHEAIPLALEGKDVVGLAHTGSGKTGAFAMPVLHRLLERARAFDTLVLSPTRELAIQIAQQFEALGSPISARVATLVGGVNHTQQAVQLGKKPHVVVGSPGRVTDHLENTKGFSIASLGHLVLDEADRLLDMDFEDEIDKVLKLAPRDRLSQLYSATMTQKVQKLQRACLSKPVKVEAAEKYSTVPTLRQEYLFCPAKHKDCYLVHVLSELAVSSSIVFTRTCDSARRLSLLLRNLGFGALPIHGQMPQQKRLAALNKFKTGERSSLVATEVAARGLDVPSVDAVINYDVPANSKDYIHRVGRTARAGRSGRAITMVTQYDVELYQKVERMLEQTLPAFPCEEDAALAVLERVSEAGRIASLQMRETDTRKAKKGNKRKQADANMSIDGGMPAAPDDADDAPSRHAGKSRKKAGR